MTLAADQNVLPALTDIEGEGRKVAVNFERVLRITPPNVLLTVTRRVVIFVFSFYMFCGRKLS